MVYVGNSDRPLPDAATSLWSHKRFDPIWNWKDGQEVYVCAFTNCKEVELFLDNQSLENKKVADFPTKVITWKLPFEEGVLTAVETTNGVELASHELKSAGPVRLLGMEDSSPRNTENYKDNKQNTYHGKLLLYIQSLDKPGEATV